MWTDAAACALAGALVGAVGAFAAEALHLALRRRRNSRFIAAGEPPFKDERFRPKWLLLGASGMAASAFARAAGLRWDAAVALASVCPALLALAGVWFLRHPAGPRVE